MTRSSRDSRRISRCLAALLLVALLAGGREAGALPPTDLYIKSFSATKTCAAVIYSVEFCNSGGDAQSFVLGVYDDAASAPTCSATPDHQLAVAALAYNKCVTQVFTRSAPAPGNYTAWAYVDATCVVNESSTTKANNVQSVAYSVVASDAPCEAGVPDGGKDSGRDRSVDGRAKDTSSADTPPKASDAGPDGLAGDVSVNRDTASRKDAARPGGGGSGGGGSGCSCAVSRGDDGRSLSRCSSWRRASRFAAAAPLLRAP